MEHFKSSKYESNVLLYSIYFFSRWNTSNVKTMSYMFDCSALESLPDISKWNTSNVEDMSGMFESSNITSLPDISKWDISKVKQMNNMFPYRLSLPSIIKKKFNIC